MFYKLLINYFRLKLLRIVLSQFQKGKVGKATNTKTMNLLTYGLEFLSAYMLRPRRK